MRRFGLKSVGVILWAGAWALSPLWASEPGKDVRTVTVQGNGGIDAVPDIAHLSAEVSEDGPQLEAVAASVRAKIGRVLEALRAQGIPDKDIQTQVFNIQPKWENDRRGNVTRVGFIVSNGIAVKAEDLKKVGKILTAVADAGATRVRGPDFSFSRRQELERQALKLAMEDAKAKASLLAQAADASLGPALTIDEIRTGLPPSPVMARAFAASGASAAEEPIAAGQQSFPASVRITYFLK